MVRFIAYSDYLCPWCWNFSRRIERLEEEFAGQFQVEWRSYLLRPVTGKARDPEAFRQYTESWQRPGAEPDAGEFRTWSGDAPPPSHSVPPHRLAKAAARVSTDAFRSLHPRLLEAYFHDNRDISSRETLTAIWQEAGLERDGIDWAWSDEAEQRVLAEFEAARALGATGVPGLRREDNEHIIVGAQPEELYRRWILKSLASTS